MAESAEIPPAPTSKRKFFGGTNPSQDGATQAAPYDQPRPVTAATQPLNLSKSKNPQELRTVSAWQTAAWNYYDQLGEIKYAYGTMAQIAARAILYPAFLEDSAEVPVELQAYIDSLDQLTPEEQDELEFSKEELEEVTRICQEAESDLFASGQAEMIRLTALNFLVAGEGYLVRTQEGKWTIASTTEFHYGTPSYLERSKSSSNSSTKKILDEDAYVARMWRPHPRYHDEPESNMLGALDACEIIVLMDQVVRATFRSRLGAGVIVIPAGLVPADGTPLDQALAQVTVEPVESEAAQASVTPLILSGPPDLADKIKRTELGRKIDEEMIQVAEGAMGRLMAALDVPKDWLAGVAGSRFSTAVVIDNNMYKAHVEPMLMTICDAYTSAYLQAVLRKNNVREALIERIVFWYNPSQIVTRPDNSLAANEGYDRFLLSGETWRRARGYNEHDAPTPDEILTRMALTNPVPEDFHAPLLKRLDPEFFDRTRLAAQEEAGIPPEIQSLLDGAPSGPAPAGTPPSPATPNNTTPTMPGESANQTAAETGGEGTGQGGFNIPRQSEGR